MAGTTLTLDEMTFDEQIGSSSLILVDFWAEWCGPCKAMAPILDEIAAEQDGKLTVAKLNVDEAPSLAMRHNVMSIPTMILFSDGEPVTRVVGAKSKAALLNELAEHL